MNRLTLVLALAGLAGSVHAQNLGCGLVVLHDTASGALTMSGNATIQIPARAAYINSTHSNAVTASGNACLDVARAHLRGGARFSGNARCTGEILYSNTPYPDPLAGLAIPNGEDMPYHGNRSINGGTITLVPGRYGTINVSGQPTITLQPGTYVLDAGLSVSGQAQITGEGVTLVIRSGSVNLSGQTALNLTPPTQGRLAGVVLAQPACNTSRLSMSGDSGFVMRGTIYAPGAEVNLTGQGTIQGHGPQMGDLVICRTARLSGQGTIRIGSGELRALELPTAALFD